MKIGSYQLNNLLSNRVPFLYFDLRSTEFVVNPLFSLARRCEWEELVLASQTSAPSPEHPIVVITDDEGGGERACALLEKAGFINVFYFAQSQPGEV